jgi:hypothetical protein
MGVGRAPVTGREDRPGYCACTVPGSKGLDRGYCARTVPGPAFMHPVHRLCAGQALGIFSYFYSELCSLSDFGTWHTR